MKLAFIGLGVMGFPMAGHLAGAGHAVTVFNRTTAKGAAWVAQYGASHAATPAAAALDADMVFSCVGNDDAVREVALGSMGALMVMKRGAIYVDHSTTSADLARELAQAAQLRGLAFLDAPVSGGQIGAEQGTLNIMVGGEQAVFDAARPILACYAQAVTLMGPAGSGQLIKMVNQIALAGLLEGLAEALNFALRAGLDASQVVTVLTKGAARSWQMENRGATMIQDHYDFGFAVDWMRKDLKICLAEARRHDAALPVTAIVEQCYARLQVQGYGRLDASSLLKLLQHPPALDSAPLRR